MVYGLESVLIGAMGGRLYLNLSILTVITRSTKAIIKIEITAKNIAPEIHFLLNAAREARIAHQTERLVEIR